MRRSAASFGGLALLLVACGNATAPPPTQSVPLDNFLRLQAQTAVDAQLSDAPSSFYRMTAAYRTAAGDYVVCGEVNAKDKLGGYVGFTPFYVRFSTDRRRVVTKAVEIDRFAAPQGCARAAAGGLPDR
jgi:hypothetical protein